jgi:molecular chaperone HtpG
MTTEETVVERGGKPVAFKAEVQQLLSILAHSLYAEREIFLRELISNASDALHRIQFEMLTNSDVLDPEAELAIQIDVNQDEKTITINDSGVGMTEQEVIENLGTIAQSSARAFLEQARESQKPSSDIIGQFGVGFYSVFMVADRVTVDSRSYQKDASPVRWESTGGDTFTVAPGERSERGTTITIHLKEDASEFANDWRIEQIIKRHSDFVSFPIRVGEKAVNQEKALWRRPAREVEDEQYNAFYKQLTMDMDEPLLHLHISTDAPVDLHAVLFVPRHRERGLIERRIEGKVKLYSRKILIQDENKDLLPTFLRFVEGVVDSEDLPLNVSRETIQRSPVLQRIRKTLTSRMLRELSDMAEKQPETFRTFWQEFGVFIKEGIATDFEYRDDLIKLLRFQTSNAGDDLVSLEQYKARMVEGQEEIYYVTASDVEAARHSPHLDPFASRGIEVLLMTDIMDSFMLTSLRDYDGLKLRNIDDTNLELPGEETPAAESVVSDAAFEQLGERFKAILGERIKEVRGSKVLRDNPARLVSDEDAAMREMQRVQQLLGREATMGPRILELNRSHPLVAQLAQRAEANAEDPLLIASAEQLYDNALLLEGLHSNPSAMVPRIQALIEAATRVQG